MLIIIEKEGVIITQPFDLPKTWNLTTNPRLQDIEGAVEYIAPSVSGYNKLGDLIKIDGKYTHTIVPLTQEEITELINNNIGVIWSEANNYVESQISGAAYGMVTALIILNKITPGVGLKGVAVKNWIDSVWSQYYTNKYLLQNGHPFIQSMTDYSSNGVMPYSVPELKIELNSIGV